MKKQFCILLLTLLTLPGYLQAQNLVPNGNFEYYTSCPGTLNSTYLCYPWQRYAQGSTDYFHMCSGFTVPSNIAGYQYPASGNGYMGGFSSYDNLTQLCIYSEYLTVQISPMIPGALYEASMSVSLANPSCRGAHNELGIWLFDDGPDTIIGPGLYGTGPLNVKPQIDFASYGIITDTLNWTRLIKYFTPDSAYDHIVIGRFDSIAGGTRIPATCFSSGSSSYYYYIDSVVIKAVTGINNLFIDSLICIGDTFYVPYTLNGNYTYISGNVFTAILSNAAGSFSTGSTIIGTRNSTAASSIKCIIPGSVPPGNHYRIRIQSTILGDASNNDRDIIISAYPQPVITTTSELCKGDTLRLTASSVSAIDTYYWYGPSVLIINDTAIIPNVSFSHAGDYILEAKTKRCIAYDTITINVKPLPSKPNISLSTPACVGDTLFIHTDTLAAQYYWTGPNGFVSSAKDTFINPIITNTSGTYKLSITTNGCSVSDSLAITAISKPSPVISSNAPICANDTLLLETNETFAGEAYSWIGPNSFSNTSRTIAIPSVQSNAAGQYIVTATYNGCNSTDTANIFVKPLPLKPNATTITPICEGDTLRLHADEVAGTMYSWVGPNYYSSFNANAYVANIQLKDSGLYIITSIKDGCNNRDSIQIAISPKPEKPIITANTPLQTGQDLFFNLQNPQAGVNYTWSGPHGFASNIPNPIIYKPDTNKTGTYFISAELNGCYNSNIIIIQIDRQADTGVILLYPSPNDGTIYLKGVLKTDQQMPLRIFDEGGKLVYTNVLQTQNKHLYATLPLKDYLAGGIYSLHITVDGKKKIFRFTVIR
jgi:hypothetical protein